MLNTTGSICQDITVEQVNDAVRKYILPVFDPSTAIASIASSKDKASEMKAQLETLGFDVQLLNISGTDDDASSSDDDGSMGSESGEEESSQDESGSSGSWQMEDGDTKMK